MALPAPDRQALPGFPALPVAFEIVHKDLQYCDVETKKLKRQSSITKTSACARCWGCANKINCATVMC